MKIGFYAPLKSPNHDIPSGDRVMARLFIQVLEKLGHRVELLSELRSWEGTGSNEIQRNIQAQAIKEVERLKQQYSIKTPPELIFTYHVYHKAPDWIGVELADYLKVPYVIAEASYAPKQENGPWHSGHQQTLKCVKTAKTIVSLNPIDSKCVQPLLSDCQSIKLIKPFLGIDATDIENRETKRQLAAENYGLNIKKCWLITVAMMRKGDKQASYHQLAKSLANLTTQDWHLVVIGDGTAFKETINYFSDVEQCCTFLGKLDQEKIYNWLSVSDVFVWPAVNEAYGLALLEAQAYGLPVIAQNFGGVGSIVENSKTGLVTNPSSPGEFKNGMEQLINDEKLRSKLAENAKKKFSEQHSFQSACKKIKQVLNQAFDS